MGLIGWADAPNSIEAETVAAPSSFRDAQEWTKFDLDEGLSASESVTSSEDAAFSACGENNVTDDFKEPDEAFQENFSEEAIAVSDVMPEDSHAEINTETDCKIGAITSVRNQVVESIRALKLRDTDGSGSVCDISKLELHEVEFLIKHAERVGDVDYFLFVREVHAVKRRLLDMTDTPDLVSSSNLDALMTLLEEKYEESFDEGAE